MASSARLDAATAAIFHAGAVANQRSQLIGSSRQRILPKNEKKVRDENNAWSFPSPIEFPPEMSPEGTFLL